MPDTDHQIDSDAALAQLAKAANDGKLSLGAVANIRTWLMEPRYAEFAPEVAQHIADGRWQELDDAFWTIIPFGTGGRRGKMYPIGSNTINDRTMGESAQGLADYTTRQAGGGPLSCAVAYDTRHRSRRFAELCVEVMVAAGFKVYFLDGYRSTPELSFAVRHFGCSCGVMITASHNPPSDNAIKAYWSTGGQLLPPHDRGVINAVMNVDTIQRVPFAEALEDGRVTYCQEEADREYQRSVLAQSMPGPRDLKIIYSPMHGVGSSAVCPVLEADGFSDVEVFGPHAEPNGDFPNVPGHVSNPENPATFDAIIERAKETGADLILSTDPDADRLGCATPRSIGGDWATFTGNQIAALLTEFVLEARQKAGTLSPEHYLAKTLVTTEMVRRIGDIYGVRTEGDLLVGFKWIGGLIDELGPEKFLLGIEESHGYQVGTYTRDKDAAVAALLMAELAARLKAEGQTLHEKLDALFWQYGCHAERTISTAMPGAQGMDRMRELMARFRADPPESLAQLAVVRTRDYLNGTIRLADGSAQSLDGPTGDMVILDLESDGNYAAVRPSGTEPKVKFYLFAYEPAEQIADLEETKEKLNARLAGLERDLTALAGS